MARRKETLKTLRANDEAPLARPKGYDPSFVGRDKVSSGHVSNPRAFGHLCEMRISLVSACSSCSIVVMASQPKSHPFVLGCFSPDSNCHAKYICLRALQTQIGRLKLSIKLVVVALTVQRSHFVLLGTKGETQSQSTGGARQNHS